MDQGPSHLEVVMAEEKSTFVLRKKVTEVLRLLASPEANISSVRMYLCQFMDLTDILSQVDLNFGTIYDIQLLLCLSLNL